MIFHLSDLCNYFFLQNFFVNDLMMYNVENLFPHYSFVLIIFPSKKNILLKYSRVYSTLPVVQETRLTLFFKRHPFFRNIIRILFICILYMRSFFLKDRTSYFLALFVPVITLVFICLTNKYPGTFTAFSATYFFVWLGIQLMLYDNIGSKISFHCLSEADPILSITALIIFSKKKNKLVRHVSIAALKSIIIGKTPMTATGRASLVAGFFTGGAWLYNSYLDRQAMDQRANVDRKSMDNRAEKDRQAMNQRAEADRQAASTLEAKKRAYINYQNARSEYFSQPFYKQKGEKPQWDDSKWEDWSKTK